MPQTWKTVRVFISSTFRDMQAERNYLVRFVFPRLREELLIRHIHLVDVDLRWGVTSEQDAFEVCREVIDECRPRFICILGDRYGWIPPDKAQSITDAEIQYAVLDRLHVKEYRYFYFRDPQFINSIPESAALKDSYREFASPEDIAKYGKEKADETAKQRRERLNAIKQKIIDAGYDPFIYPAIWNNQLQQLVGLETFGRRVYSDLLESINDEFWNLPIEDVDEFNEENAAMEAFIEENLEHYIVGSRQILLDEMRVFAERDDEPNVLIVTGKAGLGKSALLCKFHRVYSKQHAEEIIIPHFVGASVGSTDLRRILRRFCHKLSKIIGRYEEIPQDLNDLIQQFAELLKEAACSYRIVLIIDALDQINTSDNPYAMYWLPNSLPPNVRIIFSLLEQPSLQAPRFRYKHTREIELQELHQTDIRAIIEKFLERYHKRMSNEQLKILQEKTESNSPLYLLTALEELRTLGTYEEITKRIRQLPGEACPLFLWILKDRLSKDPGFHDQSGKSIGVELVQKYVSFLGVSQQGLSQAELVELIAPGDPLGNVAALRRFLAPYLIHRGELLDFYHTQFREAVEDEFLNEEQERVEAHRILAEYFQQKITLLENLQSNRISPHTLSELPYQQVHSGMSRELVKTLTDFLFIEAKCSAGMVYDLIKDYDLALSQSNLSSETRQTLYEFQQFLLSNSHVLLRFPMLTFQQAANDYDHHAPANVAHSLVENALFKRPWMRRIEKPQKQNHCRLSLIGHTSSVYSCSSSLDSSRIASAGWDGLRFWDSHTGKQFTPEPIIKEPLGFVRITPQGLWISPWDGIIRFSKMELVEENTWRVLKTWDLSEFSVMDIAVSGNGKYSALVPFEGSVVVYDLQSLQQVATLLLDITGVCSFSTDGKLLAMLDPVGKFYMWNIPDGQQLRIWKTDICDTKACALSPDGSIIAVACSNNIVCMDVTSGKVLCTTKAHTLDVEDCVFSNNGELLLTCSHDGSIKVWDIPSLLEKGTSQNLIIPKEFTQISTDIIGWKSKKITTYPWERVLDSDSVEAWAFSRDGLTIGIANSDTTKKITLIDVQELSNQDNLTRLGHYTALPLRFALSPDCKLALRGYSNGEVLINEIQGDKRERFRAHLSTITDCKFSPDGSRFASTSQDRLLKIWDASSSQLLTTIRGHAGIVYGCSFAPDGKTIASAGSDMLLKIWDVETGISLFELKGHQQAVHCCCYSPDGKYIASGAADGMIKVWESTSGKESATLTGHSGYVEYIHWTRDGRYLISASQDASIRVWDVQDCSAISLYIAASSIMTCAVSADGKFILAGTASKETLCLILENVNCPEKENLK